MRKRMLALSAAAIVALSLALPALAAPFRPDTEFTVSPRRVKRNSAVTVAVSQESGEEELASVKLTVPRGFRLPSDKQIEAGEQLGDGIISIGFGTQCVGRVAGTVTDVPVRILERDRTAQERRAGVVAVWVVDLRPVTTIDLLIRGSARKGYTLTGDIPQNELTCPPFAFIATVDKRSSESGTRIFRNPKKPGRYEFGATFRGVEGSRHTQRQNVRISR